MDIRTAINIVESAFRSSSVTYITENGDRVYNWTAPITLYRGSGRGNPDPFADTTIGYPFFTDVPLIAHDYSIRPNGFTHDLQGGKVFAYRVKLNRPFVMFPVPEPVTEINHVQTALGLSDEQAIALVRSIEGWVGEGGRPANELADEEIRAVLHGDDEYLYDHNINISSFRLASDRRFYSLAKQKGYDALIFRGPFSGISNRILDVELDRGGDTGSYELGYALEWMIFKPSCVKLLGEVKFDREKNAVTIQPYDETDRHS